MKNSKHVVAYVRVSTLEQKKNGYGIEIQRRDVRAFATKIKVGVHRMYSDKAESGIAEDREQLQKLLSDCERGNIGTIIIPSIDRLSRDVRIAENLFWKFKELGVRVLIVDMPNYDAGNRKDVLIRQIREAIAEENRKEIIERLWKGRRERVRNGRPAGGMVPYGYRRRRKTFVTHPVESVIVRKIFKMKTGGSSGKEIADSLNRSGFQKRNGRHWNARQVLVIGNRNDLYRRGVFRYGTVSTTNSKLAIVSGRCGK
jgi:site-specific DNA recombinase